MGICSILCNRVYTRILNSCHDLLTTILLLCIKSIKVMINILSYLQFNVKALNVKHNNESNDLITRTFFFKKSSFEKRQL